MPETGCVFQRVKLVGYVTLRASWGPSNNEPVAFWFGEATPFPIQSISAVELRSEEGDITDITDRFALDADGTRVVARDPETRQWLLDRSSSTVRLRGVGPGGAPMSGEIGVGQAPSDSPVMEE